MRAVISVIGKDCVGILSHVSKVCADSNANICDVTQTVMQDLFVMIMLVDITDLSVKFKELSEKLEMLGGEINMSIKIMHEDIFNSMHRI